MKILGKTNGLVMREGIEFWYKDGELHRDGDLPAMEFDGDNLYLTITSSTARKEFTLNDASLSSNLIPYTTTNGRLTASFMQVTPASNLVTINGIMTVVPPASAAGAIIVSGSNTVGGSSYVDFIKVTNTSASATNINKTMRVDGAGSLQVVNSAYNQTILTLEDNGNHYVNGTTAATVTSNDATSGSLRFNNNNSQIYDDGNMHIHCRGSGNAIWLNTNNAQLNLLVQAPGAAASVGTGVGIGTSTLTGYVTISGSKSVTNSYSYGYLVNSAGSPSGYYGGGSQTYTISLYANSRIQAPEFNATSDERLKNIQGEISTEEAINLVNKVIPIKFIWKDEEDKGIKTGFSAQQTYKAGFDNLIGIVTNEKLEEEIDEEETDPNAITFKGVSDNGSASNTVIS